MKSLNALIGMLTLLVIYSCSPSKKQEQSSEEVTKKYTVSKAPAFPAYPDATLSLTSPSDKLDTGLTTFEFAVDGYVLGSQTDNAAICGIANSGKGQHIHFIWDNEPYSALYESTYQKSLDAGNHVLLAFLSRSYHASVKDENAFILKQFTVGEVADSSTFDMDGQHLFYSRPKGTYSGADTEKLLLDFFLVNTTLSPEGNKVRATINGEEHILTEYAPYYIEGLEKGELTVKLELIDKDGNLIPGPYNAVVRKVTLE